MEKQKKILDELITYMVENEGKIVEHYVVCQLVKIQRLVDKNNIIPPVSKRTFRKAIPEDIVVGNVVYLMGDFKELHTFEIDEVLRPSDKYKAFVADDGCRYGLEDLYVC